MTQAVDRSIVHQRLFSYHYNMEVLAKYLKKFISLERNAFKIVFDTSEMKDKIIYLNTIEQLYEKGIDSEGLELYPFYAQSTILYKQEKGQRYDHVTLKDTGAFYNSFAVIVGKDYFLIDADPEKEDTNLLDIYGEDVLGLTEDSKQEIVKLADKILGEKIRKIRV